MMSDFKIDSDGTYQWVVKGGETLFTDDCAATMNQQAETIQQLKARIARLEKACDYYSTSLEAFDMATDERADKIVAETPKQSIADIQADTAISAIKTALRCLGSAVIGEKDIASFAEEYANQLEKDGDK